MTPLMRVASAVGIASLMALSSIATQAQAPAGAVTIDPDDIGGVVMSTKGPEAGVWVIAETTDTKTKLRKIVVTDDQGRYVVPDLPRGTYSVWVRGYGLVDSAPVKASPGQRTNLTATIAPTPKAAAAIYPADYWYSLIKIPGKEEFPGTGPNGNGINPAMKTQADWITALKDGCQLCHQMGNKPTREIPESHKTGRSSIEAWDRRVQAGQRGPQMSAALNRFGRQRALQMFADWSDRIAAGEVPPQPPRPQGVERNVVLTMWDWGGGTSYIHDEVATDKRNPTLNANGRVYGVDFTKDTLLWVDPVEHATGEIPIATLAPGAPSYMPVKVDVPSAYFGSEVIFNNTIHPHNPMMDKKQRVWATAAVRPAQNPAYCTSASNPFAKNFPLKSSSRQASVYDPKTGKSTPVDTCFSTHHLQFAENDKDTLYFSGDSNVIGWVHTADFDSTGNAERSQGWCPMIVDTNGDGKIGPYTEPNEPRDPKKDMRIAGFPYGIVSSPIDGAVWWGTPGVPGRIHRMEIGNNPPETCKTEVYEPPFDPARPDGIAGHAPRGVDIDRNGVVWAGLSGGPHLGAFDRRKCKVFNGPNATGQQCREGWTLYPAPGPQMKGTNLPGSSDFAYYNWVDQFGTLGMGPNVPILNGSGSDSLLALDPKTSKYVTLRVPYPLGFYSRGLDGRIDDPKAGWKGRGVWADYGTNLVWHLEGGKDARSGLVKFQLRPDPLAR